MRTTAQLVKVMSEHAGRDTAAALLKQMEEEGVIVQVAKDQWELDPEFRSQYGDALRDMFWSVQDA